MRLEVITKITDIYPITLGYKAKDLKRTADTFKYYILNSL